MFFFVICKYCADSYAALFTSHVKEEGTFPTLENCFIVSYLTVKHVTYCYIYMLNCTEKVCL